MQRIFHGDRSVELATFDWYLDRVIDSRSAIQEIGEIRPSDKTFVRTLSLRTERTQFASLAELLITADDEFAKVASACGSTVISHAWGTVLPPIDIAMGGVTTGVMFANREQMGKFHPLLPKAQYLAVKMPIIDITGDPTVPLDHKSQTAYKREGGPLWQAELAVSQCIEGVDRVSGILDTYWVDLEPVFD